MSVIEERLLNSTLVLSQFDEQNENESNNKKILNNGIFAAQTFPQSRWKRLAKLIADVEVINFDPIEYNLLRISLLLKGNILKAN